MIVNSARRFWSRIWMCGRCFYNAITGNIINGVVWELNSDDLWIDGHNGLRTICDGSQFMWQVGQCGLNVDEISEL